MEKIIQPISSAEELKAQAEQARPVPSAGVVTQAAPANTPLYPAPSSPSVPGVVATQQFLTGSSMPELKQRMLVGIYFIVGFQFIGVVLGFFRAADNNAIFTLTQVADLLLGVGLLFRLEFVRKTMVFLAAIVIVLSAMDILGLLAVQDKVNQSLANYNLAVSRIDQSTITEQQRNELSALNAQAQDMKKKEGRAMIIAGLNVGVETAVAAGTIVYLTRPKVRAVFRVLES